MTARGSRRRRLSLNRPHVSEKPYFTGFSETFSFGWLQIGYTSHLATIRHSTVDHVFKLLRDLRLLVGIQVAVGVQCGLDFLVSESVGNQKRLATHLHKQAGVGVAQVMDTDFFDTGLLTAADHLVVEKALGVGK